MQNSWIFFMVRLVIQFMEVLLRWRWRSSLGCFSSLSFDFPCVVTFASYICYRDSSSKGLHNIRVRYNSNLDIHVFKEVHLISLCTIGNRCEICLTLCEDMQFLFIYVGKSTRVAIAARD